MRDKLVKESTVEQVARRGVLRVGMSTFVPWAMQDKNGEFTGFEIDVARRLAQDMGVKVEFVPTKWSGIIPALVTGKFDIIIGGMGIEPQRNLKVNFSNPYYFTGMSLVANKEKAVEFKEMDDFDRPDVVVVTRLGTTASAAVKKVLTRAQLREFDDEGQCLQELLAGRAHAWVTSAPTPAFAALDHPDKLFLPFLGTFTREPIGFAVRKGDVDTLNFLNSWITVKEAEGWLEEQRHFWFETKDWEGQLK